MNRGGPVARNLYITAMEPQSGKSVVTLGVMELLSTRVQRLGFFRPIVPSASEPDPEIELIWSRYQLGAAVLVVVKGGAPEETVASVKAARSALEYKGCTIFGVIVNRLAPEHAGVVAGLLAELGVDEPVYVLPESAELAYPTVADIAAHLDAEVLFDPRGTLYREVRDVRV